MDQAENPVGDGIVGIEFDGLLELCESFVVAACGEVGPADGDVDDERRGSSAWLSFIFAMASAWRPMVMTDSACQ